MKVSQLKKEDLTIDIIDKILFEGLDYNGEKANCILVPGSQKATINRIPRALELYKDKKAPKLLLSGGTILETETGFFSEALLMKNKALELGAKENDLLLEELSKTTKENMICSLLILERAFKLSNVKDVIIVTTNYHMRRCILMAKTYMPSFINFIPCSGQYIHTARDTWYNNKKGYQICVDETCKIISYIKEGSIPDFEI